MSEQELILVRKKYKTFEEICPQWSYILKNYTNDQIAEELTPCNITDGARCIVGEAHGFTRDYLEICGPCSRYSYNFCYPSRRKPSEITKFVNHFNEMHIHD